MWYMLKMQISVFDGVFVKGDGYGAAPFAAKLKNSDEKNACRISPAPWKLVNYPNPFSQKTTLQVSCSTGEENVQLLIYDMTGNIVATVFQNRSLQKGKHEFPFDASSTAPGKYIAVIKGTEQVATAEIAIVR